LRNFTFCVSALVKQYPGPSTQDTVSSLICVYFFQYLNMTQCSTIGQLSNLGATSALRLLMKGSPWLLYEHNRVSEIK